MPEIPLKSKEYITSFHAWAYPPIKSLSNYNYFNNVANQTQLKDPTVAGIQHSLTPAFGGTLPRRWGGEKEEDYFLRADTRVRPYNQVGADPCVGPDLAIISSSASVS